MINQITVPVCSPELFSRQGFPGGSGTCVNSHLCPPASVDECADRLVRPCSTGVEVGAVPRLYQPHKVSAFTLHKEQRHNGNSNIITHIVPSGRQRCFFLKEQDVSTRSHLSSLPCHLTFSLSLGRRRPMDLYVFENRVRGHSRGRVCSRSSELLEFLRTMRGSLLTLCMSRATRYSLLPRYRRPWS